MSKIIKDVMSRTVAWVSPETSLQDVAQKMRENDCGCILVGENDRIVGTVTDRDITLRAVAEGLNPAETPARQVMSPKILYCRETDTTEAITRNMAQNKVRRLLVLDANKRMVGIVSLGDLAQDPSDQGNIGTALASICSSKMPAAA